jgi:hypothetical protein
MTDAVEKGFSVPERRRIFQERLPVENIDSNISYLGFYYCPSWRVRRSLIDFFNSIDPTRKSGMHRNNQDNDGLQLVFGPSPASIAGGTGTRPEHSIGGHRAQFRFYLPAKCPDGADGT